MFYCKVCDKWHYWTPVKCKPRDTIEDSPRHLLPNRSWKWTKRGTREIDNVRFVD